MRSPRVLLSLVLCISLVASRAQTAQFDITYNSVPPPFVTAFDHAAGIWSQLLVSSVPIKVNVSFFPLGANSLGITFPNGRRDFPGAPYSDTWYATSLANSIAGVELNPGENDIDIFFSNGADWYADTSGTPGPGQHDFVSVALHELGHGLGFVGVSKKVGSEGSFGLLLASDFAPLTTTFPWPQLDTLPGIFDHFLQAPTMEMLVDVPNPSYPLGSFLTCNDINWNGPYGLAASGGAQIRIYAPSAFALGSSCVHLNESTYPVGNPNELMTPFSSAGGVNHHPGLICLGMLRDIGWNLAPGVGVQELPSVASFSVYPVPASDAITLTITGRSHYDQLAIIDAQGRLVRTLPFAASIDVHDLSPGAYLLRVIGSSQYVRFIKA